MGPYPRKYPSQRKHVGAYHHSAPDQRRASQDRMGNTGPKFSHRKLQSMMASPKTTYLGMAAKISISQNRPLHAVRIFQLGSRVPNVQRSTSADIFSQIPLDPGDYSLTWICNQ